MINLPKGTKDVLPNQSYKWHFIEKAVREVARQFNANEIRTPTFEHTELFLRGVGETTDIVNKEMYTFIDKGERSITLKPEGTAGVARSFIENSLSQLPQPIKMYYITPVFRYERPQAGRLREHHQFGFELFGADSAQADIEAMMLAKAIFDKLGIGNLTLNINSIGCPICRAEYNKALKEYLRGNLDKMCSTCRDRFDKNPLRILDCKEERCTAINKDAPIVLDYLCDDCKAHHNEICATLEELGVNFVINPRVVRGLDYYTRTVFEFISNNIGAQGTVCGGGRYNNLVEEVGGSPCPAVGFGMGLERLLMVMDGLNLSVGEDYKPDLYIAPICDGARKSISLLCMKLRSDGLNVDFDLMDRSVKAQLKYANKLQAKYVAVIGDDELCIHSAKIKNMSNGQESTVLWQDIANYIKEGK